MRGVVPCFLLSVTAVHSSRGARTRQAGSSVATVATRFQSKHKSGGFWNEWPHRACGTSTPAPLFPLCALASSCADGESAAKNDDLGPDATHRPLTAPPCTLQMEFLAQGKPTPGACDGQLEKATSISIAKLQSSTPTIQNIHRLVSTDHQLRDLFRSATRNK